MLRIHFWNMDGQTESAPKWTVQKDESRRSKWRVHRDSGGFFAFWVVYFWKHSTLNFLNSLIYHRPLSDHPLWPNTVLFGYSHHSILDQDPCRLFYTWSAHRNPLKALWGSFLCRSTNLKWCSLCDLVKWIGNNDTSWFHFKIWFYTSDK